jgi:quaternary ammonium compound-resistance protein SugE
MAWVILIVSGAFEAVWAVALSKSEGFTRPVPITIFVAALIISMGGLGIALRDLPVGTGYAVWVGVGAVLTVVYSLATGQESTSLTKVALILGIIGCVIGLQVVSQGH